MPKKKIPVTPAVAPTLQTPFPPELLPEGEKLYVGVDVGKTSLYAGFVSATLSAQNRVKSGKTWSNVPWMTFNRDGAGFDAFLTAIQQYVPTDRCVVLFEKTGHYSNSIQDWLLDHNITAYMQNVTARPDRLIKSDKRDAQALAMSLYNYLEKHVLSENGKEPFHRVVAETSIAARLKPLIFRRVDLTKQSVQSQNRLTAIADELFPEFNQIYEEVNKPSALNLREKYPTPDQVASASLDDLLATRTWTRPSRADLERLKELAGQSVGTKNKDRQRSMITEQAQLIATYRLTLAHLEAVESEIKEIVEGSREGKILCSYPAFGPVTAGTLIAMIGNINRFDTPAKLRSFCGWAPQQKQTGTTMNKITLTHNRGNSLLKNTIFFCTMQLLACDTEWKSTYDRLVPRKCEQDDKGVYHGKMKVVGSIAGNFVGHVYMLLKLDADLLATLEPGKEAPEPTLYDRERHKNGKASWIITKRKVQQSPQLAESSSAPTPSPIEA